MNYKKYTKRELIKIIEDKDKKIISPIGKAALYISAVLFVVIITFIMNHKQNQLIELKDETKELTKIVAKEYKIIKELKRKNELLEKKNESIKHRLTSKKPVIHEQVLFAVNYLAKRIDPCIREKVTNSLVKVSREINVPPILIACIIKEESSFNPLARSDYGAVGLMQVVPRFHQKRIDKYGWEENELFFIRNNILLGTQILKEYIEQKEGNIIEALQKYVGASVRDKADKYIENIINNYILLNVMLAEEVIQ